MASSGIPDSKNDLPLNGLKVIDVSTLVAGGLISTFLGDYGAEVIKVEHPQYGDRLREFCLTPLNTGSSSWWTVYSRNKYCVTLNLNKGQDLLIRLVKDADVLIENFRPGTLERWNIGWERLSEINPRLVMVRVTAFGQTGPYKDRPGFGTLAEAMSGFAHITGFPDGPPTLPPLALADGIAALVGTWATMIALYHRDIRKGGKGQYIDLAIYEPIFHILGPQTTDYEKLGVVWNRVGNRVPFAAPRNAYQTKDERWVAMSATTQPIAERVMQAIGHPELAKDPKFRDNRSRVANIEELDKLIAEWMGRHTEEEIIRAFEKVEGAIAPIYDITRILEDPQFKARETVTSVNDPVLGKTLMQNLIPKMSMTPGKIRWTGAAKGAHNHEIYRKRLGISESEFSQLTAEGVV